MLQKVATSTAFARLPLRWRRRTVRAYWRALSATGRLPRFGLGPLFQSVLRVSAVEADRLDREAVYQDFIASAEWATLLRRSKHEIYRDSHRIAFPDRAILDHLKQTRRPVILAPLHMGCFALPFARIMHDHFIDRRMLILRAREDRPEETAAMRRIAEIGVDMRFLNVHDKQNYIDAVKFARAGSIIVSFVDLPGSYGGPVPITLFGQPVRIAMGIGALGRLTEATIVPLAVHSSASGDVVRFGRPFQTFDNGPDEKARVTEIIRRHIETSILGQPEQWHMWARFGEFLDPEPLEQVSA